jgi:hypothetical protein
VYSISGRCAAVGVVLEGGFRRGTSEDEDGKRSEPWIILWSPAVSMGGLAQIAQMASVPRALSDAIDIEILGSLRPELGMSDFRKSPNRNQITTWASQRRG